MKYYEVEFKITAPADAMQDARDLIAALAGDEGFEAFEETDCGTRGYVQTGAFDGGAIDRLVEDFPMDGVKIAYTIRDAEYKDWNEQWEENGFEPITIGSRCCIHDICPKATSTLPLRLMPAWRSAQALTRPRG